MTAGERWRGLNDFEIWREHYPPVYYVCELCTYLNTCHLAYKRTTIGSAGYIESQFKLFLLWYF
jgi:hypothetical protein